jgi:hypothetical protein
MIGDGAELAIVEIIGMVRSAAIAEKVFIAGRLAAAFLVKRKAVLPFQLHRRGGEEQWTAEIAFNARLFERFACRGFGERIGKQRRALAARRHEVHGAGDHRAKATGGETVNGVDAGCARGQRRPVRLFAFAERGDDAHAGDGDDGAA